MITSHSDLRALQNYDYYSSMATNKCKKLDYHFNLRSCWRTVMRWADRAHQRKDLAELESHRLKDLGISSDARSRECAKPFWRK